MEAKRDPAELRRTGAAVVEFRSAFEGFLDLHEVNTTIARGLAPAAFPVAGVEPKVLRRARSRIDEAAGYASRGPALTNTYFRVQGIPEAIDPIAAWATITLPKPALEPDDILTACGQMISRLEMMAREADALRESAQADAGAGVTIAVLRELHPRVWGAAERLWADGYTREAIAASASAVVADLKRRTGRNDVSETSLWKETLSGDDPKPGRPRLRWPGDPADQSVKTMSDGLRNFAAGVQLTIRNPAVHAGLEMTEQDGLERLAALSLLARWIDRCEIVGAAPDV